MLEKHSLFFTVCCFLAESTGSTCLHWDRKSSRIGFQINIKKKKKILKIKTFLHGFLTGTMLAGGVYKLIFAKKENIHPGEPFLFGYGFLCMIWFHVLLQSLRIKATEVCQYINGIFQLANTFRPMNLKSKYPLIIRINVVYAYVTCYFYTTFPMCTVYGLHWMQPCKSSLIGYWILPECSDNYLGNWSGAYNVLKILVFLLNHYMWSIGCHAGALSLCGILIMCTVTLWDYLRS